MFEEPILTQNMDHFFRGTPTESEALLMAMQTLRQDRIPSLPIHDSLLIGITVPDAAERGIAALQKAWPAHSAQWVKAERKSCPLPT